MNIGVLPGDFEPTTGGGFTFQENVLSALLQTGSEHKFYILCFGSKNNKQDKSSPFIYINLFKPFKSIKNSLLKKILIKIFGNCLVNKALKTYKIDILWFMTPAYLKVKVPFVFTVWDLAHRIHPYFPEVSFSGWKWGRREKLYSYEIPRAAYVITGTEAGRKEITRFYHIPEERVKIIPFPTPTFALNSAKSKENVLNKYNISGNYLFYPAQFWPHKNHIAVLKTLKILKEKYSLDFNSVFSGFDKGNLSYIREKARELNLLKNIRFINFVPVKDLCELYRNAFAMVYPTYFGPDNLPPLEAFALGCPVIASELSGSREQLEDCAILINPKNPDEIAEAVFKLYKNPDYRDLVIQKGLERSRKSTSKDYINKIMAVFNEFEAIRSCWSSDKTYSEIV